MANVYTPDDILSLSNLSFMIIVLLPSFVAVLKKKINAFAIFVLNLLTAAPLIIGYLNSELNSRDTIGPVLGSIFLALLAIGWLISLVWSLTQDSKK